MKVSGLLKNNGNHVYYLPLTDEILLHTKSPPKHRKLGLYLTATNKKSKDSAGILFGELEYIGKL